ncbi:MAG: hypothetical protein ABIC95_05580 [archaeon]
MVNEPESMDDVCYFTNRIIGEGQIKAWVSKGLCPACKNAKMGKPVDKNGSVKIRAKEYVCPACGHTEEKTEFEATLTAEAIYTCPECGKEGSSSIPFKRKKVDGADALRFVCEHCETMLDVTKKLKDKKKKNKD